MSAEGFGAMAAFTGNLLGSMAARDAVRETNQTNKGLAMWDAMFQRQMIKEQNEYNSPVNQMARYKEAGLNPNLMFGSIGPGQQSEIPKYQMPQIHTPDMSGIAPIGEAIQLFLQEKKTGAEIDAIQAQTARYREETKSLMLKNSWESFLSGVPTDNSFAGSRRLQEWDLGFRSQQTVNNLNYAKQQFQHLKSEEQRYYNKFLLPLALKTKQLEYENLDYRTAKERIDSELWRDLRNSEIMSNPLRAASHLGVLFGRTDVGKAWKDTLQEVADFNLHDWSYKQGQKVRGRVKTLWQKYAKRKK